MLRKRMMASMAAMMLLAPEAANAEILAMMSYESKSADSLKSLKGSNAPRREAIAIMDVDPASPNYGKVLWEMPLDPDRVTHHIFYDRTMTKAYVTALAKKELLILDLTKTPFAPIAIEVDCTMGEDVVFDESNSRWFLTCMNSANVIVGDVATDEIIADIALPGTYPHGLTVHSGINRILVTSTVSGDNSAQGEVLSVVDATSYEPLGTLKLSHKPSSSGAAPVEVVFVPGAEPAIAYATNMLSNTLWTATWDAKKKSFELAEVYDFQSEGAAIPLEIYFLNDNKTMYVTTASPGRLHVFDISKDKGKPKHVKTLVTGEGSHHVAFTKDGKYAFVQNALLNLPGISEGTINVVDMSTLEVVDTITTLADAGYNPNVIVLLPEWHAADGH